MRHKSLLTLFILPLFLSGCSNENSPSTPTPKPEEPEELGISYKVDFTTIDLDTSMQESYGGFKSTLLTLLKGEQDLVDDIDYDGKLQLVSKSLSLSPNHEYIKALMLASQKYDGELSVSFKEPLKRVVISGTAQYAWGYDPYGSGQIIPQYDEYAEITLNEQSWAPPQYDDTTNTIEVLTSEYIIDSNTLVMSSLAGERCYIHSLTFYY